jgi:hypothetical protein
LKTKPDNIDLLQQSLKDRFNDFEYQVAIDIDVILEASTPKNTSLVSSSLKYYIAGATIVAGILLFGVFNNQTKTTTLPKPTIVAKKELRPNESIKNISTAPISLPTIKEKTPLKTSKQILKNTTTITPLTQNTTPITEEQTLTLPTQTEEHVNFEHFVSKKSSTIKDSLELFIKKK